LIGESIKRIKVPGYSVGSRETILNNLAEKNRAAKSNKASQTRIDRNKVNSGKVARKKKAK